MIVSLCNPVCMIISQLQSTDFGASIEMALFYLTEIRAWMSNCIWVKQLM